MTMDLFTPPPTPPWTPGKSWAVFSACKRYRYALGRYLPASALPDAPGNGLRVLVAMLNPSKAGEHETDPTVAKLLRFGIALGWRSLVIVNPFAAIATHPRDLAKIAEPVGPLNDAWINEALTRTDFTIAGWGRNGTRKRLAPRIEAFARMLFEVRPVHAFRLLEDGTPEHPLFMPGDTKPSPWTPG